MNSFCIFYTNLIDIIFWAVSSLILRQTYEIECRLLYLPTSVTGTLRPTIKKTRNFVDSIQRDANNVACIFEMFLKNKERAIIEHVLHTKKPSAQAAKLGRIRS